MMRRQKFVLRADTGDTGSSGGSGNYKPTAGDTGPPFFGEVKFVRFIPQDTGAALGDTGTDGRVTLTILPKDGDSGEGFDILSLVNVTAGVGLASRPLSVPNIYAPMMKVGVNGDQTTDTGFVPYVGAGDRIRAKYVPGYTLTDSGHTMTIYVWTGD